MNRGKVSRSKWDENLGLIQTIFVHRLLFPVKPRDPSDMEFSITIHHLLTILGAIVPDVCFCSSLGMQLVHFSCLRHAVVRADDKATC